MSTGPSDPKDSGGSRLGGARADFVASLGRKVQDARELIAALEDDPSSRPPRDELRRKLHALGSGARLLRFEAMARSLAEALTVEAPALKSYELKRFTARNDRPDGTWSQYLQVSEVNGVRYLDEGNGSFLPKPEVNPPAAKAP